MNSERYFYWNDSLADLNTDTPLNQKFAVVHRYLRDRYPFVVRIAAALYDPGTDTLKTFAHSTMDGDNPLPLYEARLSESQSLCEILQRAQPRVVNDIDLYGSASAHADRIRKHGYGSSYTMPIYRGGEFLGFLFFNAREKKAFQKRSLHFFDMLGHLLALLIIEGLSAPRALVATVRSATALAQHRDFETGSHMDRMSHYARIIAREVAPEYGLSDAEVENIFLFSPLHDIGKIGISDEILFKKESLTPEEFEIIKTHTTVGHAIVDSMLANFHMDDRDQAKLLRNITLSHHEALDGSGYPHGIKGDDIPIEARIVAVADVFDALTSTRPYKPAWSLDEAFQYLIENAENRFDRQCVAALVRHRDQVEEIQRRFREDPVG